MPVKALEAQFLALNASLQQTQRQTFLAAGGPEE
jgi:hypothetical protein